MRVRNQRIQGEPGEQERMSLPDVFSHSTEMPTTNFTIVQYTENVVTQNSI